MSKITIQSNGDNSFRILKSEWTEYEVKAKNFELQKIYTTQDEYKVRAKQVYTQEVLFWEPIEKIEVDGTTYDNYEDLSEVLTPILFKKGGGSGGGGTGTVTVSLPLTGDGDTTPLGINPASSISRGTMSSANFTKLANFQEAENYALKTDLTASEASLQTWVNNKNYATQSFVSTNYYNKTEVDSKLTSVYKSKGSVANFGALPASGNTAGDVWNLLSNGDNYVWVLDLNSTGLPGWDKLSGIVDLSAYHTIAQYQQWVNDKGYATEAYVIAQTLPATQTEVETATGSESIPMGAEPAAENRKFISIFNFFKLIKKLRYIHLLPNSATAVANRLRSNGFRLFYANNSAVESTVAYTSDLPTTFVYTPTGNFTTSQLKTAAEAAGLIFNGLHFIIKIGTNNYTCTIDNGSSNTESVITFGKRGTTGSINFASNRTLRPGAENITILNGNVNSLAMVNFDTSEDFLTIYNNI